MDENNTIQTLDKLLVDVSYNQTDEFLSRYYRKDNPDDPTRLKDYDNKLSFLHKNHKIFTQGELFGGTDLTVDTQNYQINVNGTTYSLNISNGILSINPYTPSKWGSCYFVDPSTNGSSNTTQNVEWDAKHEPITLKITPSNKISYTITHGTTEIVLTGIHARKGEENFSYIYGGSVTIINGIIESANYVNTNISGNITISPGTNPYVGANELEIESSYTNTSHTYWNASTNKVEKTISVNNTQDAKIYYHEKGQSEVYVKDISIGGSIGCTVTPSQGYFLHVGPTWQKPANTQPNKTTKPTTIHIENSGENDYAWVAIPVKPTFVQSDGKWYYGAGCTPLWFYNSHSLSGGMFPVFERGSLDTWPDADLKTFNHYTTNTKYYIYRTEYTKTGISDWVVQYS